MDPLLFKSASHLARALQEKWVSSEELVRAMIDRIEAVNPRLNAVVLLASEQALKAAREADRRRGQGELCGPLLGIPFTLKDAIETEGVICTGGTEGRKSYVPSADATVVRRLRAAGAVLLGKTNCPEFGWAWESDNLIYGRTNNPFDLKLSPGGSSGGESAMIAAGGSAFGLGSDAGGSVRFPAHCTGIAAIKPTSGRVPRTGHFPGPGGTLDSLWQIGPLARSVDDLALILPVITGPDFHDPSVVNAPIGEGRTQDIESLRIAFHTHNGIVPPADEVADVVKKAAAAIASAGARVEELRPPGIEETYDIYLRLFSADGGLGIEQLIRDAGTTQIHPLLEQVLAIQRANACTMADFVTLVGRWDSFRSRMLAFMEDWDAILCPVAPFAGMRHGATYDILDSFSYTMSYNLTGWPAAVVRAGWMTGGLPVGVQIVARPWREDVAIAVAKVIETALGGFQSPPL
ncbi:MAG: amidase [Acidobacteria bacterium]|nr:amidase [Acidobacteriota bacterium]